jgi:hypothetical protein
MYSTNRLLLFTETYCTKREVQTEVLYTTRCTRANISLAETTKYLIDINYSILIQMNIKKKL